LHCCDDCCCPLWADEELTARNQEAQLTTAAQVLDRYKQALGGEQAIANVQSMMVRGEAESAATYINLATTPCRGLSLSS
jgi:hypothetical protein